MPTILFNAGHFLSYAGHTPDNVRTCPALSGVNIQIKSEITPDAAGQNAGLSGVLIKLKRV